MTMFEGLPRYGQIAERGWLGEVPEHWQVKRSKLVLRERDSRSTEGNEKLLRVSQYTGVTVRDMAASGDAKRRSDSLIGYKSVQRDDLVVNIMLAWNGSLGVSAHEGVTSPAYCVYRIGSDAIPRFLHYLLRSEPYKARIKTASTGVVESRLRLYTESLYRVEMLVPPLEEQEAIVRFLDWANGRLERVIRGKRKVIALLTEQKQAIIHRAVTRGLDPTGPLKPSGIPWLGDIPAHWETVTLKAVCTIQSGITVGKDNSGKQLSELPYLRVANVQAGYVNLRSVKSILVSAEDSDRFRLVKGDVLMTEGGDIDKLGRGGVWDGSVDPCLHQNHLFAVRPNQSKLLPEYFALTLQTGAGRSYFESTAKQTTNLASTNRATIGRFKFALPSVDSQKEILSRLEFETRPIHLAIQRLQAEILLFAEYRTRLTADVVTGKLDVGEASKNLPVELAIDPLDDAMDEDELEIDDEEATI
jgi:type I restriction enzyme, S subunit